MKKNNLDKIIFLSRKENKDMKTPEQEHENIMSKEYQWYAEKEHLIAKIEERINEVIEKEKTYATAEPFVAPETYWGELKGLEFALKALKGE